MTMLNAKQKEENVIELLEKGCTIRAIALELKMSFSEIGVIRRKWLGEDEIKKKPPSITSQAFKLFLEGKTPVEVAIILNLQTNEVIKLHSEFLTLQNRGKLVEILNNKDYSGVLLKISDYVASNKVDIKKLSKSLDSEEQIEVLISKNKYLEKENWLLNDLNKYLQEEICKINRKYQSLLKSIKEKQNQTKPTSSYSYGN